MSGTLPFANHNSQNLVGMMGRTRGKGMGMAVRALGGNASKGAKFAGKRFSFGQNRGKIGTEFTAKRSD